MRRQKQPKKLQGNAAEDAEKEAEFWSEAEKETEMMAEDRPE